MTRIVSYYPRNVQFQLSSQAQLADAQEIESVEGFKWVGRTLTSWTDQNNVTYAPDQTLTADSIQPLKLSASWELNKYNLSVDFKSEHGKVIVTTSCDELPLFSPATNSIELTKDGQTSSSIFYNSLLSIDVIPENEEYKTARFDVNGASQTLSDQYVYRNAAADDKTSTNEFNIIVDFVHV